MTTSSYMPKSDDGKADLLEHLVAILPKYATILDISARDFDELKADTLSFRYALQTMEISQASSQSWTSAKEQKIEPTTWKPTAGSGAIWKYKA